jgi:hypothetical protein
MKLKSFRAKKPIEANEVSVGYHPKPTLNKATFLLVFAALLAAASFYEGTAFQHNADTSGTNTVATTGSTYQDTTSGSNNAQAESFISNHVIGQVTAVSGKNITIQDQRTGSNTTLGINSSTQILADGQTASPSDIQTGDLVIATKESSHSSTASKIIVAPGSSAGESITGQSQSNTSSTSATPLPDLSTN